MNINAGSDLTFVIICDGVVPKSKPSISESINNCLNHFILFEIITKSSRFS